MEHAFWPRQGGRPASEGTTHIRTHTLRVAAKLEHTGGRQPVTPLMVGTRRKREKKAWLLSRPSDEDGVKRLDVQKKGHSSGSC